MQIVSDYSVFQAAAPDLSASPGEPPLTQPSGGFFIGVLWPNPRPRIPYPVELLPTVYFVIAFLTDGIG